MLSCFAYKKYAIIHNGSFLCLENSECVLAMTPCAQLCYNVSGTLSSMSFNFVSTSFRYCAGIYQGSTHTGFPVDSM